MKPNSENNLDKIMEIIKKLRSPNGCLWDSSRTKEDIGRYVIEEAYEVLDAIYGNSSEDLKEELGDLLFQILFLARLAEEADEFTIGDVIGEVSEKMMRRHPHVFGNTEVTSVEEINANWEKIKQQEQKKKGTTSMFHSIPRSLPSLLMAQKVTEKASGVGFDWDSIDGVLEKVQEELEELKDALPGKNKKHIEEELGDLLFSMVNLSRFVKVKPETALRSTINKFIRRFSFVENKLKEHGKTPDEASLQEMDHLWELSKKAETED